MHRIFQKTVVFLAISASMVGASAQKPSKKARPAESGQEQGQTYANRPEAEAFVRDVAQQRHIDEAWLRASMNQSRFNPTVQRLMTPRSGPAGVKNWRAYRSRFVEPIRIRAGLRFWEENAATLARAEQTYGVPAEMIVGIIGVETIYGQQMGSFSVVDALATLAFDYPQSHPRAAERAAYFRRELEQFLTTAYLNNANPFETKGSYAGAMGMPQFMPSSWSEYAVDFDGDGKINLFTSRADAIGSVANYFVGHGWQRGMPSIYNVQVSSTPTQLATLLEPDIKPSFTAGQMAANGVQISPPGNGHTGPLALIEMKNGSDETQYVAGTQNFYTITRYNWSSFYAMSVIQLGEAIKQARNGAMPSPESNTGNATEPGSETSNSPEAAAAARAYLRNKARQSGRDTPVFTSP